jgi:hypothetical protein
VILKAHEFEVTRGGTLIVSGLGIVIGISSFFAIEISSLVAMALRLS